MDAVGGRVGHGSEGEPTLQHNARQHADRIGENWSERRSAQREGRTQPDGAVTEEWTRRIDALDSAPHLALVTALKGSDVFERRCVGDGTEANEDGRCPDVVTTAPRKYL